MVVEGDRFTILRRRNRSIGLDSLGAARPVGELRAGGPGTTEPGPSYEELHPPRTREQILADHAKRSERLQRDQRKQSIDKKLSKLSLQDLVVIDEYIDNLREPTTDVTDLQGGVDG